jgi:hypothetical protein
LFGRSRAREHSLCFVEAQRKVLDYARFLETSAPMPGRIADVSSLPHPKEKLQSALLMCIGSSSDAHLEEHLKHGYLMLSAFQSDVGEQQIGVDFANLDLESDPVTIAEIIECKSAEARDWEPRIQAELQQLQQDLYTLELELSPAVRLSA